MLTKDEAIKQAKELTELHGKPWVVFRTPDGATCNKRPGNLYNTGRYAVCELDEKEDYAAGGAVFED